MQLNHARVLILANQPWRDPDFASTSLRPFFSAWGERADARVARWTLPSSPEEDWVQLGRELLETLTTDGNRVGIYMDGQCGVLPQIHWLESVVESNQEVDVRLSYSAYS